MLIRCDYSVKNVWTDWEVLSNVKKNVMMWRWFNQPLCLSKYQFLGYDVHLNAPWGLFSAPWSFAVQKWGTFLLKQAQTFYQTFTPHYGRFVRVIHPLLGCCSPPREGRWAHINQQSLQCFDVCCLHIQEIYLYWFKYYLSDTNPLHLLAITQTHKNINTGVRWLKV